METIKVNKKDAIKIYNGASEQVKQALKRLLGDDITDVDMADLIDGWESVAEMNGLHPLNDLPFPEPKNEYQARANAFFVMDYATDAYNGRPQNYDDKSEKKFYEWLRRDPSQPSGFEFSSSFYAYDSTDTHVGARLTLLNERHVLDRWKKFEKWFAILLTKTAN